uniref:Uncharacterized protein n=1 Tax=Arundo donax TaxID=35708 RepID=A0A0A9D4S4_ARUDO
MDIISSLYEVTTAANLQHVFWVTSFGFHFCLTCSGSGSMPYPMKS